MIIGAATFFVIYGVGLALATAVHQLNEQLGAPAWLQAVGGVVEAAIFIGDMLGLLLAHRLWSEWKELQDG